MQPTDLMSQMSASFMTASAFGGGPFTRSVFHFVSLFTYSAQRFCAVLSWCASLLFLHARKPACMHGCAHTHVHMCTHTHTHTHRETHIYHDQDKSDLCLCSCMCFILNSYWLFWRHNCIPCDLLRFTFWRSGERTTNKQTTATKTIEPCMCRSVFSQSYDTSGSVADETDTGADLSTWAGEASLLMLKLVIIFS